MGKIKTKMKRLLGDIIGVVCIFGMGYLACLIF